MTQGILIDALRQSSRYPHPVASVELAETHISWLLLTGEFAYKIKKPVNLGFLDFSTLEKRRFFCQEELRLNRRFAPELYLGVIPITGPANNPTIGGTDAPIEYAVQMRQFDPAARLDRLLAAGQLSPSDMDDLATTIAQAHGNAAHVASDSEYGMPELIDRRTADTIDLVIQHLPADERLPLAEIQTWCRVAFERLRGVILSRRETGHVRECHGDLHLENIVRHQGRPLLFDCLEFSAELRWIDTFSDLAFVTMDLAERGRPDFANRLLNQYLETTGDYAGLDVLRYYQVYRALVRAAVCGIRAEQEPNSKSTLLRQARMYLGMAHQFIQATEPFLLITHGPSGSGKSTVTGPLVEQFGAIRLRSDVARQQLHQTESTHRADRYSGQARRRVYLRLAEHARTVLQAGYPAIVDATFLNRVDRDLFHELACRMNVSMVILNCRADPVVLAARIAARVEMGGDPSEATPDVLREQLQASDPLTADERVRTIEIATDHPIDTAQLVIRIRQQLPDASPE